MQDLQLAERNSFVNNTWGNWINTSSNDIIRRFLSKATGMTVKREIERLVAGETVTKEVHLDLTYQDIDKNLANLWSVLFTAGYLTQVGEPDGDTFTLRIPNLEIRKIFTQQIYGWFKESAAKDGKRLNDFCEALKKGDAKQCQVKMSIDKG